MLINNTASSLNNITIVGKCDATEKIEFSGLKLNNIPEGNYTIYYSEKENAEFNLQNNDWIRSSQVEDIDQISSYAIVLEDYEMPVGGIIQATYNVQIEENLDYNQSFKNSYEVIYAAEGGASPKAAKTIEVTTGAGPILEVNVNVQANKKDLPLEGGKLYVYENQRIKCIVEITNTGTTAQDVKVDLAIPSRCKIHRILSR